MANYKILFPQGCGVYKQGDVVEGCHLGDTAYLLRVGAIEETKEKERRSSDSVDIDVKVQEAVEKALADSAEKITTLEKAVEDLKSTNEDLEKKLKDSEGEIEVLETTNEDLEKQVEKLTADLKKLQKPKS